MVSTNSKIFFKLLNFFNSEFSKYLKYNYNDQLMIQNLNNDFEFLLITLSEFMKYPLKTNSLIL